MDTPKDNLFVEAIAEMLIAEVRRVKDPEGCEWLWKMIREHEDAVIDQLRAGHASGAALIKAASACAPCCVARHRG
jgi:hypothetical protein